MLRNYITIALRNIQNNPVYSTINVLGLTIGIVSSILLFLYVQFESSYDQFHKNKDHIYRITAHAIVQDTELNVPLGPVLMAPVFYSEHSVAKNFVRLQSKSEMLFTIGEHYYYQNDICFADSSFFSVFDFPLISGNPKTCLVEPNSIVICQSLAEKWFPDQIVLGQSLLTDGLTTRKVTGVMADTPGNTSLNINALISYSSLPPASPHAWGNMSDEIFILLNDEATREDGDLALSEIYNKYMAPMFSQFGASATFSLQPLTEIHLYSNFDFDSGNTGDIGYLYIFSAIGFFMLLIACINYMNLATARSVSRSKEVGIRKAMGSYKTQLMGQFVTESVVIALIALIISVILTFFLIPFFNQLASIDLDQQFIGDPVMLPVLVGIILFVGLVGGSYPAFYLSKFRAAEVLKGRTQKSKGNEILRKVLVVAQFSISLGMVVSTWIVFDQLDYLRNKELGFNQKQVVNIALEGEEVQAKLDVLEAALSTNPNVESVGSGIGVPGSNSMSMSGVKVESQDGSMIEKIFQNIQVDNQFFPTLEIPIIKGRNFLPNVGNDTANAVIVNEELVQTMGWDNPIGKKIHQLIDNKTIGVKEFKVVGVVRNYHSTSLQEAIAPMIIYNSLNNPQMIVRLKADNILSTMGDIEEAFKTVVTNRPFEYTFLDQSFQKSYDQDQKRGEVFAIFSTLTIAIACLGLFGLASYTAEARRKEIGIRKVVGASVISIVLMMSKDYLKLIVFSMIVAFPITYYLMDEWLQNFAYAMQLRWSSFALSALVTILIAFATVLYHSLRSAVSNPSAAIRDN